MSEKKYAGWVGLFVVIGLVLIGGLMLTFSRGVGFFKAKYQITMRARSVAGLKPRSAVFLSGVQIGNVDSVELDQGTKSVLIRLQILQRYPLRRDARFVIEQIGVLGDQFVIIYPGSQESPLLTDGAEVQGEEPFNLLEVARSTTDLLKRFDQLGASVGQAVERVNKQVLDGRTLSNLSQTIGNFERVSERTLGLVDNTSAIVTNNAPALAQTFSNMVSFSRKLEKLAMDLDETVVTNRSELNESMKNLRDATASMKQMTTDLESGKGLVGGLLKDERMRLSVSNTFGNLEVLSSNLSRFGLLYKPKEPKSTVPSIYSGKSGSK